MATQTPIPKDEQAPSMFLYRIGIIATASAFLPLLLFVFPFIPDVGTKTVFISTFFCLVILLFMHMQRKSLWEEHLQQSARGAQGIDVRLLAYAAGAYSMLLGFFLAMGGGSYLEALTLEIRRFLLPILQLSVFAGITFLLSTIASFKYMAFLDEHGFYDRPRHLNPDIDLAQLAMEDIKENLGIPDKKVRIIEREHLSDGGVCLVVAWEEKVKKNVRDAKEGDVKEISLNQEQKYEVRLSIRGTIVSLREHAG
jgi:hypothetical protein